VLLLDDLLLFAFKQIAQTADKELYDEDAVKRDLQALYRQLETRQISEREFERREQVLVRRLEKIAARTRAEEVSE
jgi:hypothetical protein